jgi:translation initiation factor IF-2
MAAAKTLKDIAILTSLSVKELKARFADSGINIDENDILSDSHKKLLLKITQEISSKNKMSSLKASTIKKPKKLGIVVTIKKKTTVTAAKDGEELDEATESGNEEIAAVESQEPTQADNQQLTQEGKIDTITVEKSSAGKSVIKDEEKSVKNKPKTFTKNVAADKGKKKSWGGYDKDKSYSLEKKKKKKSKYYKNQKANMDVSSDIGSDDFTAKVIKLPETIRVADLAQKMSIKSVVLMKVMMENGVIATVNQMLDQETAALIVEMIGHEYELMHDDEIERDLQGTTDSEAELMPRAPVVTIMGHVDHGKTTLLDFIRSSRISAKESGGITQHIGAYHVDTKNGVVTFLDTPGHEAFTAMRARGAKITDIVILVVAADDSVMPQTIEAISHVKAGDVSLVVAINKMDKPGADPDKVMTELSNQGIVPEEWGGDVLFKKISAKTGEGVEDLLDSIALQSEMLELTAANTGLAQGVVIEAKLDKGRGPVITVLVQSGQLNKGDIILIGPEFGKVRAMIDDAGNNIKTAGPSMPVEVLGLSGLPRAGDKVTVLPSEKKAREVALYRKIKFRDIKLAANKPMGLDSLFDNINLDEQVVLNIVLKADVDGSLEAINESLIKLSNDRVKVVVVSSGVGAISESDANLALASNALIMGFNVRADTQARAIIEREDIQLYYYSVIYDLLAEVKSSMKGLAAPQYRDKVIGLCEVRSVFRSSKHGVISGCMVLEGIIKKDALVSIIRDNVVVFKGSVCSLRRYKDDVLEVKHGIECGISIKDYRDIKEKDQLEVYVKELVDVEM